MIRFPLRSLPSRDWGSLEGSLRRITIPLRLSPATACFSRSRSPIHMPAFRAFLLVIFFVQSNADKYDYQQSARFAPCGSRTLTANIRRRRGSKVAINLPIYIDERTPRPFVDPTIPWHRDVFPEDAGAPVGSMVSFCEKPIIVLTTISFPFRGETWRCPYRSHLHGCDGFRHGLLLSSTDVPML